MDKYAKRYFDMPSPGLRSLLPPELMADAIDLEIVKPRLSEGIGKLNFAFSRYNPFYPLSDRMLFWYEVKLVDGVVKGFKKI